jgi:hypothetical protein
MGPCDGLGRESDGCEERRLEQDSDPLKQRLGQE